MMGIGARGIKIPCLPQVVLLDQSLVMKYYDVQSLLQVLREFINGGGNKSLVARVVKIMANSLNDLNLLGGLESVLQMAERERIYELMLIWVQSGGILKDLLRRMSVKVRKIVLKSIFCCYFLKERSVDRLMANQLSMILGLQDRLVILNSVKQQFLRLGGPLKTVIVKGSLIKTQNYELLQFLHAIMQFGV